MPGRLIFLSVQSLAHVAVALILSALLIDSAPPLLAQEMPPVDVTIGSAGNDSAGGLRLTAFSAAFLASPVTASVLIGVEVDGLTEATDETRKVDFSLLVDGAQSSTQPLVISVPLADAAVARRAAHEGLRALTRIDLPVGHHDLRVSVRDSGDQRAATLLRSVDVPNLLDGAITMSQLLISGSRVSGVSRSDPSRDELLPISGRPPTGRRAFSPAEQIEVNAQIYTADAPDFNTDICFEQLRITTRLESVDGRALYETSDVGQSEPLPSGVYGYDHYALVQVSSLPPGQYILRVTASDGSTVASRAVPITIADSR